MIYDKNISYFCADLEANGLLRKEKDKEEATRIWCLSFCNIKDKVIKSVTDTNIIRKFFEQENTVVIMHYGVMYDIPLLEKLLNFKVKIQIIDSLTLSWTLFPQRTDHNLENWGNTLGIVKLPIINWNDEKLLPQYVLRCESDIKIQTALWEQIIWMLDNLYDNEEDKWKYCEYLTFKFQCVQKQSEIGVKLDIPLIKETLMELEQLKLDKIEALTLAMPKVPIKAKKSYPKVFRKADGSLSSNGQRWLLLLQEQGFSDNYTQDIEVITGYAEPNPNSHSQVKSWLFSLKWNPSWFKYVKEEGSREMRKIPQIASKDEPGEVCESIKKLIEKEPNLEELNGLGIISHRISILKGFLRDQIDGRLYQGISNLTNTLRLCHTKIVNLPSSDKPHSENIRAALIPDNEMIMCGTDLKNVEDNTKRHFIFPFDPEYVKSQMTEGFDAHLDIARIAGMLTEEQVENHKKGIENHKLIRAKAKQINFSAIYGIGSPTLSRNMGISKKEAQTFIDAYWKRNWAVKKVAESLEIKQIGSQMWLLNPVSKFWYSLRAEKDKFSTLNQGTAVYVFDKYVENALKLGIIPIKQIHDEFTTNVKIQDKEIIKDKLQKAIDNVNKELKLNITVGASVDFGENYSLCH